MQASRSSGEGVRACSGAVQNSWPGVRVPFTRQAFVCKNICYVDENIIIISVILWQYFCCFSVFAASKEMPDTQF